MLNLTARTGLLAASMLLSASVGAETLHLKDQAAITGRILAEKKDSVAVDVGYTVLVVPKSAIAKIDKQATPSPTLVSTESAGKTNSALFHTSSTPREEKAVRELVAQLGQSVVQVRTPGGLGSGFFISEDGYLITNFHVIEGETQISLEVFLQEKGVLERKTYKQIRIVAMNKFADLALLKVEDKDAGRFSKVFLGDADIMGVGERVFAIGSPLGLERTVTEGIISTKTRELQGDLYLQTTAQINPGNSGGPLFNLRGEVIGVTNMKITFGEGLGFAIPVEVVKYFLNHREAYAYDNDNPNNPYRYLAPPSRAQAPAPK